MSELPRLTDFNVRGKRVLIRADLNVPMRDGKVADDTRIRAFLPTLEQVVGRGGSAIVVSHLGRPKEGQSSPEFSLRPVADYLGGLAGFPVKFAADWLDGVEAVPGTVVVCENVRFNVGEKSNSELLARRMAALCDLFVMDAFGTAHRAHASTQGVACFAPSVCAGPLLETELRALDQALDHPRKPVVAIVGGAKVAGKLTLLGALLDKVDCLVVGGGIANTFLAAAGHSVGKSVYEPDLVDAAKEILAKAQDLGRSLPLPSAVVCAKELSALAVAQVRALAEIGADDMILDVAPAFAAQVAAIVKSAGTVLWNGPLGVFEYAQFAEGTRILANAIAESAAFSIAGGGDTLAAIAKFRVADRVSYISTGGGAFLEYVEGKQLPGVAILLQRAARAATGLGEVR